MHQQIFVVLFFLSCLQQSVTGSVIVNGRRVKEGAMLYMASLQNVNGQHLCGGFLVSEQFVLTAAHCFDSPILTHKITRAVLGNHKFSDSQNNEQIIDIVKKFKHPSYISVGYGSDMMLLKLKERAVMGNNVQIIYLPSAITEVHGGEVCQVAGWGATRTGGESVKELMVTDVSIIDITTCTNAWNGLPPNVICAGGSNTNKGFCQGDSGGPLVCKNTAVGIVSFNRYRNCNYEDEVPNVYTDISKYKAWIFNTIGAN